MTARTEPDDQWMDQVIGRLLQAGVVISAIIVLAGGVLYLARHGSAIPHYRIFRGEPTDLRSVTGILRDLPTLRARAIIQFGLLLLIATPVARVLFSIFAFAKQRDRLYVAVTIIVLVALCFGLFFGRLP